MKKHLFLVVLVASTFSMNVHAKAKGKVTQVNGPGGTLVNVCCQPNGACTSASNGQYTCDNPTYCDPGDGCTFGLAVTPKKIEGRTFE